MKLYLYSIYDSVAEVFNKPFSEVNDAAAIRAFKQSLNDNPNSKDYYLYHIGIYNDATGQLEQDQHTRIADMFTTQEEPKMEAVS